MESEEEENNQRREHNIPKNNPQVMEVALAVTKVEAKNDDHYVIWISKQGILFFEICL